MANYDVLVIGAGPAGAVCARHLAGAGLRTALMDRVAPPRYKTCGGGVVGKALPHLGIDITPFSERTCCRAELNLLDAGLGFEVERSEPVVVMTMRAELDRGLVRAAEEVGVELLAPCAFEGLAWTGSGVEVVTDRGTISAAVVVAADGAGSAVARAAGWQERLPSIPALESEIRVGVGDLERLGRAARFDFGVVSDGYCWVFPKREHLSVGCLATRGGGGGLKGVLEEYIGRLGLGRVESREDHGFVIPVRPRRGRLARDGVLLVGDAAGLADPVTCEGISNAAASGRLAAEAIVRAGGDPVAAARAYLRALDREVLPELRRARLLARLLYGHPRLRRAAFRRLGRRLAERMTDVIVGRTSYRELTGRPGSWLRGLGAVTTGSFERE